MTNSLFPSMGASRDIMSGLAGKQAAGMMRRSARADWMRLAGMRGLALLQERRFRDESENMREIRRWRIVESGEVPWNVCAETDYPMPPEYRDFGDNRRASPEDSVAREDVRAVMGDWCRWEREVHGAYGEALGQLEDPLCIRKVSDMMSARARELEVAEGLRSKLEQARYDMEAIADAQDELAAIYGKES